MASKKDIRVDARGHVSLLGIREEGDATWYSGHRDPDGTIHLVPALLVPARLKETAPPGEGHLEETASLEVIRKYFPDAEELKEP